MEKEKFSPPPKKEGAMGTRKEIPTQQRKGLTTYIRHEVVEPTLGGELLFLEKETGNSRKGGASYAGEGADTGGKKRTHERLPAPERKRKFWKGKDLPNPAGEEKKETRS